MQVIGTNEIRGLEPCRSTGFICLLSEQLISNTDTSKVVISGDWNTTLNPIDKRGGQPWKATNYRNSLMNLMEELNLIDIYRQINHTKKYFTYESKPLNLKSRIKVFLISRPLSCCVKNTEIRTSIAPNRKSIFLNIEIIIDYGNLTTHYWRMRIIKNSSSSITRKF